jgi:gluconate 2-dehydrogenase gamma chain
LTTAQHRTVTTLLDDLLPADGAVPGAGEAGGADYVDQLLGAFDVDPPRIWAAGPHASGATWLQLGPWEQRVWRRRVAEWSVAYTEGLAALGDDYEFIPSDARAERRSALDPAFVELVFTHAVEGLYGDPVYGGNRDGAGWASIGFEGDRQGRGWTDDEVTRP